MSSELSFELTDESKVNIFGHTVYRIRATRDIQRFGIRKGDLGGWVQSLRLDNGDARVSGDAWVSGNARVYGNARVSGDAQVSGDARVSGDAQVSETWHYIVVGPIGSEGVHATVFRKKNGKHGLNVGCWDGRLGTLMAEVKRRRAHYWVPRMVDEATQTVWMEQYRALKTIGRVTVSRWAKESKDA